MVTVLRDALTLDVLHRYERQALFRDSAVDQSGYAGMTERRKDLALDQKACKDLRRVRTAARNLERDVAPERLDLAGQIHFPHAAPPERAQDGIRPDSFVLEAVRYARRGCRIRMGRKILQELLVIGCGGGGQQAFDLATKDRVIGAGCVEEPGALPRPGESQPTGRAVQGDRESRRS